MSRGVQGLRACSAAAVLADVDGTVALVVGTRTGRGRGNAADQQRSDESQLLEGHDSSPLSMVGGTYL
jgi:hypothetical protein